MARQQPKAVQAAASTVQEKRRGWVVPVVVPIVVAIISAGGGFATAWWSRPNPAVDESGTSAAIRDAEILAPADGSKVSQVTMVAGRAAGLRPGEVVWLLAKPTGSNRLHPATYPCETQGATWRCPTVVVGAADSTGTFELIPAFADARAQATYIDYLKISAASNSWPGLEGLPEGAFEAGPRIRVVRG